MAFFLPFSFFLSSLPSLTSSAHHSPLFIFVRECIWQGGRPAFISQDIPACISESEEIYYILVRMATRGTFSFQLLSRGAAGRLRCCDAALRWERAVLRDENKEKCGKKSNFRQIFWIGQLQRHSDVSWLLLPFCDVTVLSLFTILEGNSTPPVVTHIPFSSLGQAVIWNHTSQI